MRPTAQNAQKRPQERAGRETSNHSRERSRRNASRPCLISVRPGHNPPRHPPPPPLGTVNRLAPAPIGRNAARKSPHVFLADFGRETRPKATRHPARRTWARPGPRTSRFPLRLRPWEPTGSRPGARTAPADLRALQFSIACAERADRARPDRSTFAARRTADGRGERPLQHDISRA